MHSTGWHAPRSASSASAGQCWYCTAGARSCVNADSVGGAMRSGSREAGRDSHGRQRRAGRAVRRGVRGLDARRAGGAGLVSRLRRERAGSRPARADAHTGPALGSAACPARGGSRRLCVVPAHRAWRPGSGPRHRRRLAVDRRSHGPGRDGGSRRILPGRPHGDPPAADPSRAGRGHGRALRLRPGCAAAGRRAAGRAAPGRVLGTGTGTP